MDTVDPLNRNGIPDENESVTKRQPSIVMIAAVAKNNVIGILNKMPWNLPEDYSHFLSTVSGNAVLIGSRSWRIFGADLSDCDNYILSRQESSIDGIPCFHSIEKAMEAIRKKHTQIFCAGGAKVYRQIMPMASRMIISHVHADYPGDAYFPAIDPSRWHSSLLKPYDEFDVIEYVRNR